MATPALNEEHVLLFIGKAAYASLHSGNPGTTGATEITTVPRQPLVWTAGDVDGQASAAPVTFNVPGGVDVAYIGIWSAASGGTFLDSRPCVLSFVTPGSYTMTLNYVHT